MREIKFRGKYVGTGEGVYGDLIHKRHTQDVVMIQDEKGFGCDVWPDTVGQYTGLKDAEGLEIYEGDLVKSAFSKNIFGMVAWHSNGYFYLLETWDICQDFGESDHRNLGEMLRLSIDGDPCNFKIIGNIHDNKELTEK